MTPLFASARRAAEFDELVSRGGTDERYADLLTLVADLRDVPAVQPRPEFSALLREQLLTAAETALVPTRIQTSTQPRGQVATPTKRRERRVAAAVAGVTLVGATSGLAMASQSALPGDPLYGVKRALESVHTQLTFGDASRGQTLLDDASGRLTEVDALSSQGGDTTDITDTLQTFASQANDGANLLLADYAANHDPAAIVQLRDFTGAAVAQLAQLDGQIPQQARPALLQAATAIFAIDAKAQAACPDCGGTGVGLIPPSLVSDAAPIVQPVVPTTGHRSKKHSTGGSQPSSDSTPVAVSSPGAGGSSGSDPDPVPSQVPTAISDPVKSLQQQLTQSVPTSLPVAKPGNPTDGISGLVDPVTGVVSSTPTSLPLP